MLPAGVARQVSYVRLIQYTTEIISCFTIIDMPRGRSRMRSNRSSRLPSASLRPRLSFVRTQQFMKTSTTALIFGVLVGASSGTIANPPATHPLYGKWTWTLSKTNCTETYEFRPDNTTLISSGDERAESRFSISEHPDANGFYRMTDTTTKSNGRTGCDGESGGTPVGDTATSYIFFHPTKSEMLMCEEPSFDSCMGPLRRISQ